MRAKGEADLFDVAALSVHTSDESDEKNKQSSHCLRAGDAFFLPSLDRLLVRAGREHVREAGEKRIWKRAKQRDATQERL